MNIALTPEAEEMIAGRVASGKSASSAEVIHQALLALAQRDLEDAAEMTAFAQKMEAIEESIDRGEFVEPELKFARLRERGNGCSRKPLDEVCAYESRRQAYR